MKFLITLIVYSVLFMGATLAQKAPMESLDLQPDGNYYQRNHQAPFSGVAFENFPNGKKKSKAEFKNGKLNGKVTTWHNTGEKATLVQYKNGQRTATETHWYDTGVKKLEINYDKAGKASGICKEYYPDGVLKSEGQYTNGAEEGLHKWYFKNGKLDQTVDYKEGKANGKVKHYYENGKLKMDGNYANGEPNGKVTYFHNNGKKKRELSYKSGTENGLASVWSKGGLLQEERDYAMGKETAFRNYRSGAIKTKDGFLQVFNDKDNFFQIHIADAPKWVRPKANREITYVVNRFVLQLFDTPNAKFSRGASTAEDVLSAYVQSEKAFIEKSTQSTITPQQRFDNTQNGTNYLHWWFTSPGLKNVKIPSSRTVEEEHYFSVVAGNHVLTLYVPKTKGNNIQTIERSIKKMLNSLKISENRIDLNSLRKEIRVNAGLPALPKNETFEGYEKKSKK